MSDGIAPVKLLLLILFATPSNWAGPNRILFLAYDNDPRATIKDIQRRNVQHPNLSSKQIVLATRTAWVSVVDWYSCRFCDLEGPLYPEMLKIMGWLVCGMINVDKVNLPRKPFHYHSAFPLSFPSLLLPTKIQMNQRIWWRLWNGKTSIII